MGVVIKAITGDLTLPLVLIKDVTEDEVGFLHNLKNKSFFTVLCTVKCTILQGSAKEQEKIFL